ncbi:YHYH protein [Ekhidna sp.]|uniref:YHYH protein n=1 Tax=Ekhidna sp. TaxID=2608089 RepID=UPI003CCBB81B
MNRYLIVAFCSLMLSGCGEDLDDDIIDHFSASVSIISAPSSVGEDAGTISISIDLNQPNTAGFDLSIPLSFSGTATLNDDYIVNESSVTIGANETEVSFDINISDDSEVEGDETIVVTLGNLPELLTEGSKTAVSISISDNDTNANPDIEIDFGAKTGNTIVVNGWTDTGADSYLVVINTEDSFAEFSDQTSQLASTTYIGYGEQVVFNGTTNSPFEVSLLSSTTQYYFKVIPKTGTNYDNSQSSTSSSTNNCVTTNTTEGQVCFDIASDLRTISSNQLANHEVGSFPNADPTAIEITRELDLSPTYTGQPIYVYDETGPPTPSNDNFWQFGIATNGVEFHPMGLKPWENPNNGEENWEWQAKVTDQGETHVDVFGAHVTSQGLYHYHGDIVGLAGEEDGSRHSLIYGFAADGFPIYYKYGYAVSDDPTSEIIELKSSYQLKSGVRTGTGTAGVDYPDGNHDGNYIQDFEYVANLGDLDECNGRTGITPEYPGGTYYYVITSEFPVTPNCFFGTPAEDWKIGR